MLQQPHKTGLDDPLELLDICFRPIQIRYPSTHPVHHWIQFLDCGLQNAAMTHASPLHTAPLLHLRPSASICGSPNQEYHISKPVSSCVAYSFSSFSNLRSISILTSATILAMGSLRPALITTGLLISKCILCSITSPRVASITHAPPPVPFPL